MISLRKGNVVMEVASELQASVFTRNGYERVETKADTATADAGLTETAEKPKRRTRKAKSAE